MGYNKGKTENIDYRSFEGKGLLFVTCVLLLLMFNFIINLGPELNSTEKNYQNHTVINLDQHTDKNALTKLLTLGNFVDNQLDAKIIAEQLVNKLQTHNLPNLGALNKKDFMLTAYYADSIGGKEMKERVLTSLQALNYSGEIEHIYQSKTLPKSKLIIGNGLHTITAKVKDSAGIGVKGVVVRLTAYLLPGDTAEEQLNETDAVHSSPKKELIYYATSDENGITVFSGLTDGGYYSLIPIRKWYEYGPSKGTIESALNKDLTIPFVEKRHLMKLFGNIAYSQLKENKVLTIRTPNDFKVSFGIYMILFFLAWWLLHLYLFLRQKKCDELILPILMGLTGICVIIMYAIHDPLRDEMHGNEMVQGVIIGLFLIAVFTGFNIVKWFNSRFFDPFSAFMHAKVKQVQPGTLYFILALIPSFLLFFLGTGPEGSGVKINLGFFQPSEITKYLMIVFFAAYFSKNSTLISQIPEIKTRITNSLVIFIGLGVLLLMYLLLGDLGPALVLCGTFIIFYAVARGDFFQLVLGTFSYILLIFLISKFVGSSILILASFSLLWLALWILFSVAKKTIYESAIFMVLVIAAFIFGETLPGVGQRLKDRNDIYANIWNNQTYGGDQVAQGVWSLSSGGLTGQGIGKGNSNVMPAHHTDMILASIGEELGWLTLCILIVCLALLIHRSLLIGRKAAHPFAFYLAGGIAVVTGLQFFIIAAGSLGIIPLTGITVPFLSYGRVSMIINLAAFGIILSISQLSGSEIQNDAIRKNYDNTIVFGSFALFTAFVVLIITLFYYQVVAVNRFIVKPAFVINQSGERLISYNPRINLLMKKLVAGNIYDRNELLLATNNKDVIKQNFQSYRNAGVSDSILMQQIDKRQSRYYPFGANMFFWTGNFNNRILWGNESKGFFAEERYLAALRGFETKPDSAQNVMLESNKYKENRFLPKTDKQFEIPMYDYSELVPLLKAGINSSKVKQFNKIKRNITLSVDAVLQTQLQNNLYNAFNKGTFNKNWRASVVVLNAGNGEVLSSALYPRPNDEQLKMLYDISFDEQKKAFNKTQINGSVFTESDLGTTFATAPGSAAKVMSGLAGFIKLGAAAANKKYHVYEDEIFRVGGGDPDPVGDIDMETAIVHSSNVYFIKLVNDQHLDNELSFIYQSVGVGINERRKKNSYTYYNNQSSAIQLDNKINWQNTVYKDGRSKYYNTKLSRKDRLNSEFSKLAWGQGKMTTTPLVMARVASIVANGGAMHSSKFVIHSSTPLKLKRDTVIKITNETNAAIMKEFMKKQTANFSSQNNIILYGKTGTPQREVPDDKKNFDGWFVFFTQSEKMNSPLVVCIRIERAGSSAMAKKLASEVVIPTLKRLKYVK